ncbi:hypothetical protein QAD02_014311 [Eretmocerus hayati]|uniref:Uncharacterized protein n=1 Tax=Eretmocerus hayati TaxID=131215 RepID=A0ACC2P5E6_9HYME|nr:hypothetical protein QAD02_014311 [Eretmocerus hayati]
MQLIMKKGKLLQNQMHFLVKHQCVLDLSKRLSESFCLFRKRIDCQQSTNTHEYEAIIQSMIEKFSDEKTSKKDRELIMSFLPRDWSIRRRADFFGATKHFVTSTDKAFTKTTSTRKLLNETVESVEEFYQDDHNSRVMPGMKDVVCSKDKNGEKIYTQKRLVLSTLRELYISFKDLHPEIKIGFSKFAQFRPKHCVLPESSGTHTVCVCIYHQNVKLMLEGVDVSKLTSGKLNNYKDCISLLVCEKPSNKYSLNQCRQCPGVEPLKSLLLESFEQKEIDQVQFQFWLTTDRCKLQTRVTSAEEFVEELAKLIFKLKTLRFHYKTTSIISAMAQRQSQRGGIFDPPGFCRKPCIPYPRCRSVFSL